MFEAGEDLLEMSTECIYGRFDVVAGGKHRHPPLKNKLTLEAGPFLMVAAPLLIQMDSRRKRGLEAGTAASQRFMLVI